MRQDLFRFVEGSTIYTLTSGDEEVVYNLETYTPVAGMSRSAIEQRQELNKNTLQVRFPIDNTTARQWMTERNQAVITLSIFITDDSGTELGWKGRCVSVLPDDREIVISFESVLTSMRREGLGPRMLKRCRFSLYGRGCKLDKEDFAVTGSATSSDGRTVTISGIGAYADNFFTLGILKNDANEQLGFIVQHASGVVTLQRSASLIGLGSIVAPVAVTLYPGCDRSRATCEAKFNNLVNYGGLDWIPTRNPLDGSSIV